MVEDEVIERVDPKDLEFPVASVLTLQSVNQNLVDFAVAYSSEIR